MMTKLYSLRDRVEKLLGPIVPLLVRLVLGKAFFDAGLGKLQNLDRTAGFFENLGIPLPGVNAAVVGFIECAGGVCLILGLGTRISALLLIGTMVVALATAHLGDVQSGVGSLDGGGLLELAAFAYLLFLLVLLASGPGPLSVDGILTRNRK